MEENLCISNRYLKWKKYPILKAVTVITHIKGWFEIMKYDNKFATTITNLVETKCLTIHP